MKIQKDELKLAKAFIDANFKRIVDWTIGDIKRCCKMKEDGTVDDNGALVGAFILWCCAIDYFGGLYTGFTPQGATKARFKAFIEKYMTRYDFDKVKDLRWSLTHYYSPRHFLLYHQNSLEENKPLHLTGTKRGILLHLGWAVKDLEDGVNQYAQELEENNPLKIKLWRYYKEQFPIMPVKVENLIMPKTFSSLASGTSIKSASVSGTVSQDEWLKK